MKFEDLQIAQELWNLHNDPEPELVRIVAKYETNQGQFIVTDDEHFSAMEMFFIKDIYCLSKKEAIAARKELEFSKKAMIKEIYDIEKLLHRKVAELKVKYDVHYVTIDMIDGVDDYTTGKKILEEVCDMLNISKLFKHLVRSTRCYDNYNDHRRELLQSVGIIENNT